MDQVTTLLTPAAFHLKLLFLRELSDKNKTTFCRLQDYSGQDMAYR